mmetsp:Transcript_15000/g.32476  ORF Transcript_15000/g.32476 Transcript_15000/m.32476 type:complete len:213 (+) Transcript_15000:905-1543(+)
MVFKHLHQPRKKRWVHGEVEVHCLVHDLGITNLHNGIQEQVVVEGVGTFRHDLDSIVKLLVSHVEVDSGSPETSALAGTDDFGHVELAEEHLAMFHDLIGNVLSVKNSKFSEDTNVSVFQTKSLLKERNEMIKVTKIRVEGNHLVQMIRVFDDLKSTSGGKAELVSLETGKAHLLPSRNIVRLGSCSNSLTVLLQMNVTKCKLRVVVDVRVE